MAPFASTAFLVKRTWRPDLVTPPAAAAAAGVASTAAARQRFGAEAAVRELFGGCPLFFGGASTS